MRKRDVVLASSALLFAACSAARSASPTMSVALFVAGDEALAQRWPEGLGSRAIPGISFRRAALPGAQATHAPHASASLVAAASAALVQASRAFRQADFAQCREVLRALSLEELLRAARRDLASRALVWQTACAVGEENLSDARAFARRLAVAELDLPSVATRPDVENLLAEVVAETTAQARWALVVAPLGVAASVAVDGREPSCRTPCTLQLYPGAHVLSLAADGFEPLMQTIELANATQTLRATLTPASAERAAEQWSRRFRGAGPIDTSEGMALLSIALRAPRLVGVHFEAGTQRARLAAVLALDGRIAARSERFTNLAPTNAEGTALLRELLVRGRVLEEAPPVYASPWFWVGVAGATVAASGVTAYVLTRPIETRVTFGP